MTLSFTRWCLSNELGTSNGHSTNHESGRKPSPAPYANTSELRDSRVEPAAKEAYFKCGGGTAMGPGVLIFLRSSLALPGRYGRGVGINSSSEELGWTGQGNRRCIFVTY